MKLRLLSAAVFVTCLAPLTAQDRPAPPRDDAAVFEQIRREGLEQSQVMTAFDQFVTVIGPRLSGTPAFKAAADWSRETLAKWGLSGARLEPFEFGRGWVLERQVLEMIEPRYMPLVGYAEAWSASTRGELVGTPVMVGGRTPEQVEAMKGSLAGAIVLTQPVQTAFVREDRPQPTESEAPVRIGAPRMPRSGAPNITRAVRDANPGVMLRPSAGEHGTMFVLGRDAGENAQPSVVLAAEHYNMIARMLEKGVPVKLRVNVQTRFVTDDTKSYNVIAEIPGTDPALKDEIVMIGAHLDSWHSATGATDNADGSAA